MGIELGIGALVAALSTSFTVLGSVYTVGQVLLTVALTAASFASSLYSQQQQKSAARKAALAQAGVLTGEGAKETSRAPVVARRTIYGTVTTGGVLLMPVQFRPPYQYIGLALAAHECDGLEEIRINNIPVKVGPDLMVTSPPYMRPDGVSLVKLSFRAGKSDQAADPVITAGLPEFGPAFRQRGCATLFARLQYGRTDTEHSDVYGSELKITVRIRGKKVYDPRDPTQIQTDSATWKWRDSPTLCAADYSVNSPDVALPPDLVDWPTIGESASIDEEMVPRKDLAFERRYTVNGIIDTDAEPPTVLRNLLAANRGRPVRRYGRYGFMAGHWSEPVMTIHDGLLAGGIEYRADTPRRQRANVVRTRFVAPERDFQIVDGPVLERPDLIAEDGTRYERTLSLEMVEGASRAQRLAKAFLNDERRGRMVSTRLGIEAFGLEAGDTVRFDVSLFPHMTGIYAVEKVGLADMTSIPVTIVETDADIYAWDPAVDEKSFFLDLKA